MSRRAVLPRSAPSGRRWASAAATAAKTKRRLETLPLRLLEAKVQDAEKALGTAREQLAHARPQVLVQAAARVKELLQQRGQLREQLYRARRADRARKDKAAPPSAPNAWTAFLSEELAAARAARGATQGEGVWTRGVLRAACKKWAAMSEAQKEPYREHAAAAARASPRPPRRKASTNAWGEFLRQHYPAERAAVAGAASEATLTRSTSLELHGRAVRRVADLWRAASAEEKAAAQARADQAAAAAKEAHRAATAREPKKKWKRTKKTKVSAWNKHVREQLPSVLRHMRGKGLAALPAMRAALAVLARSWRMRKKRTAQGAA